MENKLYGFPNKFGLNRKFLHPTFSSFLVAPFYLIDMGMMLTLCKAPHSMTHLNFVQTSRYINSIMDINHALDQIVEKLEQKANKIFSKRLD